MRIGFASIYSWRPHVEHLAFLARLVSKAEHEVRFLTCDADLPTCYTRKLRPQRAAQIECTACRLGGVRSYETSGVTAIGRLSNAQARADAASKGWGASSASTIGRFESDQDFASAQFAELKKNLDMAAAIGYESAKAWIDRERLDAVVAFNGRMDVTRGIFEAAKDAGIRYLSMERTWFGDGLQLLPDENCLGLRSMNRLVTEWSDKPLTYTQAHRAAAIAAARFSRSNTKEWRAYNTSALYTDWPAVGRHRVLLVPGSRSEVWGHPDRTDNWPSRTEAYDALIAHLGLTSQDLVLRAHPNWNERIGQHTGTKAEKYYREWAQQRNITFIPSADRVSTLGLIEQADAVVVAGSSAGLEAGIIGKRIIALAPSEYEVAGFAERAFAYDELGSIQPIGYRSNVAESERIARCALRFCYTVAYRIPQYVAAVSCVATTRYKYSDDADPSRIVNLIRTGRLISDDDRSDTNCVGENAILAMISARRWSELADLKSNENLSAQHYLSRRALFRPLDSLRTWLPKGDR